MSLHFQDETRLGRMTRPGRRVVKRGVKPVGIMETCRENFYIYGSVDPINGDYLMMEMDKMSRENFQLFLDEFGKTYREGFHMMVCDGSAIHWSKELNLPENLALIKLPPYCPELNPIERVWQEIKKHLKWKVWPSLQSLKDKVFEEISKLGFDEIYTLTAWDWILDIELAG